MNGWLKGMQTTDIGKIGEQELQQQAHQPLPRRWLSFGWLVLLVFVSFFLLSCHKHRPQENFILITLDTQRADHIGSYHGGKALTPNIDFLAREGILYENCYSLIPITLPSHASIFFSEPPYLIKNYNNGQPLSKKRKRPSFVNVFRKNGYVTAAFVSLGVLKSKFGLDEGFSFYKDDFPKGRWYLAAEEVNRNVFPWLEENRKKKFFLWIHYSDPHDPYAPPSLPPDLKMFLNDELLGEYSLNKYTTYEVLLPLKKGENVLRFEVENIYVDDPEKFQARFDKMDFSPIQEAEGVDIHFAKGWLFQKEPRFIFSKEKSMIVLPNPSESRQIKFTFRGRLLLPVEAVRKLYREEVEYMDGEIGKLWDKLREQGLFDNTHILMVGDHGEGLGEYRNQEGDPHIGHIHFLYNIYMEVPLIIYNPHSRTRGKRITAPVTLLDIAPTILATLGWKRLSHFQGRNLLQLKEDKSSFLFQETYRPEAVRDRFAVLRFPWHLILTPEEKKYELFDLREDPDERVNIFQTEKFAPGLLELKEKLDSFARMVLSEKEEIKIDKKTEEMLRALGYIK